MDPAKYYSNPFADDDDVVCFAEIEIEDYSRQQSVDPTPTAALSRQVEWSGRPQLTAGAGTQALQQQLEESEALKSAMKDEYDTLVKCLREDVEVANKANNELLRQQSKLETRILTITLEKENLEWTQKQDKERVTVLEKMLNDLKVELSKGAPNTTRHHDTQQEHPGMGGSQHSPQTQQQTQLKSQTSARNQARESQADATGKRELTYMTEKQKQAAHAEKTFSLQQLEVQLLEHSRSRDNLRGQLQRLESARVRSAVDIRKRAAVEKDLESEEQEIGKIKLAMRGLMAAK